MLTHPRAEDARKRHIDTHASFICARLFEVQSKITLETFFIITEGTGGTDEPINRIK
jgi:hypothetical protein